MKANPLIIGLFAFLLAIAAQKRDLLPDFLPDVLPGPAVDSPFPSDGSWLLVAAEAGDLTGVEAVGNAKDIRSAATNRQVLDFDNSTAEPPWNAALDRAESKGSGKPYYLFRNGSRASEGPLEGDVNAMHKMLQQAVGVQ